MSEIESNPQGSSCGAKNADQQDELRDVRTRLAELSHSLGKNNYIWPARSIDRYLRGEVTSLDEAFGLVPESRRGRPVSNHDEALAREIFKLRWPTPPMPWTGKSRAIDTVLGRDEKTLRRIYAKYRVRLMSEALTLRMCGWGKRPGAK